jgi:hypothetical protein
MIFSMILDLDAFQVDYIIPPLSPFRIGFRGSESYTLYHSARPEIRKITWDL